MKHTVTRWHSFSLSVLGPLIAAIRWHMASYSRNSDLCLNAPIRNPMAKSFASRPRHWKWLYSYRKGGIDAIEPRQALGSGTVQNRTLN